MIHYRKGDANRALLYFNKSSFALSMFTHIEDETLFIYRSCCQCKLGNFDAADQDANVALDMNPYSVKGLLAKGEAQYNMGSFEHALKYFYR